MPSRILPTNVSILQRSPRVEEPNYLEFIRQLPCLVCMRPSGAGGVMTQPAHIRFNDARYRAEVGGAQKDDDFVLPLCPKHHKDQTDIGEGPAYWEMLGMDAHAMCLALRYRSYPDLQTGEQIVRNWNGWIRT